MTNTDIPRAGGAIALETLADTVITLGRLALEFGRVNRVTYHPDGHPESDTDHTVMLGWLACSLAAQYFPQLDLGLVAQFALVHDAPEVFAGDTNTLRIDQAGRDAKKAREAAAVREWRIRFGEVLPWVPDLLDIYERQIVPEARFVRGLDKLVPKIAHLLNGCRTLREQSMSPAELADTYTRQRRDLETYVGEFAELMALRTELVDRTVAAHREGSQSA